MPQLLQPKQQLAGYEIVELVGKGGMGEVYSARQISMDREVALKILAPRLVKQDPIFAKRFVDEARAAGRLNHPNIIAVHDVGKAPMPVGGDPTVPEVDYFSMEFVNGESVKEVIDRQGICPLSLTGQVMLGMSEALVYAEAQGIVHRDIKPDNIMITTGGVVKLADLGLALQLGGEEVVGEKDEKGRGKVMGTPLYMSPEQARALPVDSRSDQYSLGATLFHMLTGKPPFKGDSAKAIMKSHVFDPVPDPKELNPDLTEPWRQLCIKLMSKNPEERFDGCPAMRTAVQAAISGQGPGVSKRIRANGMALAKDRAQGMPSWARWLVYGFVAAVAAMVVIIAIPWGGKSTVEPVKPPGPERPVPADPALIAAKLVERVQQQLKALPAEPEKALVALEKLAGDKTIPAGPARELIVQETARRKTQLDDLQRKIREQKEAEATKVRQAKALEIERAMAAGDLSKVKECLDLLLPEFDKLSKSTQDRVATIRQQFQVGLVDLQKKFTDRLVQARAKDEFVEILAEVKISPLSDEAKAAIVDFAAKRSGEAAKPTVIAVEDDRPLWIALAEQLEPLRGGASYPEVMRLTNVESAKFPPDSREQVKGLGMIARLASRAEVALDAHIATSKPTVELTNKTGNTRAKLVKYEKGMVTYQLQEKAADATLTQDLRLAGVPLKDLVDKAVTGPGVTNAERLSMLASFLWMWRSPDAAEIFALIPEDPLAKAAAAYDLKSRLLALRGRMSKDGRKLTVTYDLTGKSPWAIEDFIGDGATLGDRGLNWATTKRVDNGNTETDLPLLRWKESLLPPVTLAWHVVLHPNTNLVLFGVAVGDRRVRLGFSNAVPFNYKVLVLATKDDGVSCEPVPKSLKTRVLLPVGELIKVDMVISADSRMTVRYNDQVVTESFQLPTGKPITPIIQAVILPSDTKSEAKNERAIVDVPLLSISGMLPEGK